MKDSGGIRHYPVWTGHKLCPRGIHSGCSEFAKHTQSFAIMISPPQSQLLCPPVPPSPSKCHHFSSLHVSLKLLEITLLGSNFIRSLYDWCFLAAYGSSFLSASPASRTGQDFHRPSQPFVRRSLHSKIQTPKLDPKPRTNPNHLNSKILHEGSSYFTWTIFTNFKILEPSRTGQRMMQQHAKSRPWACTSFHDYTATQRASGLIPPAFADSKKTSRQNRHVPCDQMTRCIAALPMPRRPCCGSLH